MSHQAETTTAPLTPRQRRELADRILSRRSTIQMLRFDAAFPDDTSEADRERLTIAAHVLEQLIERDQARLNETS